MKKKTTIFFLIFLLFLFSVIIIIFFFSKSINLSFPSIKESKKEINVFFCPEQKCKEKLIEQIDNSSDIKCAFYELNLEDIIKKLKEKKAEVVIEDSTFKEETGFNTGFSKALMHNKFCVFDNKIVFTGSMNPTKNDNYQNNNNIIIIESPALAQNYLEEFKELKNNIYGKGGKVKNPLIQLGDTIIENYFCPEDNCKLRVINELKKANSSIYFMTFSFTDEDIGNLLWNKHYLGLDIKGIFDKNQISQYSRYEELKDFSIIDKNMYKLHHKVFIIDNKTVITGSYNPTRNANEYNDENIVIIKDREIAKRYIEEFNNLFFHEEKMPELSSDVIIYSVLYDALGKDEGNEYVELKNIGINTTDLSYYSLSDNKTNMRLYGSLEKGKLTKIIPSFSLKNTNGTLLLKHNAKIIDFLFWEGEWRLEAKEGTILFRKEEDNIGEDSWISLT